MVADGDLLIFGPFKGSAKHVCKSFQLFDNNILSTFIDIETTCSEFGFAYT